MRLSDFWERMDAVFTRAYARSWAADQQLAALDGRTVEQALRAGEETREVWRAVCAHVRVPPDLR